ncbi:MAG: ATP-dependent sacrificial sulfur transferase LarE [Candidatus Thorarchaeota archaeon]
MAVSASKFEKVRRLLQKKNVLVAFSGGVDSAVLAHIAKETADSVILLTIDSITFPKSELNAARELADQLDMNLKIIEVDELKNKNLVSNPPDRCYHCKSELAAVWLDAAKEMKMDLVVDGTNITDMEGHRPGARALEEAGVISPFRDAGITKEEIREYARNVGLPVADRPSMACLSSRFPYGTEITESRVRMVDQVEQKVKEIFNVRCVRARFHGDVARIEVGHDERENLFDIPKLNRLHEEVRAIGFKYVAIDAIGYRTGSMDEVLE